MLSGDIEFMLEMLYTVNTQWALSLWIAHFHLACILHLIR